jgi:putative FmdB family regulatory protein
VPTYGYHCPSCDAEFEVRKRMTDATGADCPRCGTPGRRVFFPAGIVFKGSGFYKTDSRRAATASVGAGTSGAATAPSNGKSPSDANAGEKAGGGDRAPAGEKAQGGERAPAGEKAPGGERAPAGEKAPAGGSPSSAKKDRGASTTGSGTPS